MFDLPAAIKQNPEVVVVLAWRAMRYHGACLRFPLAGVFNRPAQLPRVQALKKRCLFEQIYVSRRCFHGVALISCVARLAAPGGQHQQRKPGAANKAPGVHHALTFGASRSPMPIRFANSIRARSETSSNSCAPSPTKSLTERIGREPLSKPTMRTTSSATA